MNALPRTHAAIPDSAAARRLIELLSRIHPLLLVYDAGGTVRWVSDGFTALHRGEQVAVGRPLCAMLPESNRLEELRSRFEQRGFLPNAAPSR